MMKHAFLLLAFAALAVSLPSDVPETFVEVATAESILPPVADVMDVVSPKVSLVQVTAADHEQARAKVTALLQQGNDQSACSQMAQTALDEVTAAVKAQQDALDEMDKGATCDAAGDQHKEDAKTTKENAATTLQQAKETLAAAQSTTVDLGSYKWSQLNPQSCASLFDIEGYTSVTKAVNDAQSAVNAAQGVLDDATQKVEDAVQKAADMVTECKCKVMEEQAAALEKMNTDAKEANTKTWNQAKLMQCVLDGTSESNCDLGTIPVVTETELADGVSDTFCSGLPFKAKLGARNGVPPREYTFRLAQVNPSNNYGDDFRTVSKEGCRKIGMLPVCDHPSYCKDDANAIYLGQDHHISHGSHMQNNGYFPSGWNEIKKEFYGTCMYSFNANGPNSLCNNDASGNGNGFLEAGGNPWGSHAWLRPSNTQGNGKDGKPNRARFFMCAKINHRTFKVDLGAKNGVPARTVAFKIITAMDKATGEIDRNMIKDCNAVGMKPVCDHPNYCKDNADSFYVGQDHHFAHSPHRRTVSYYPSGWQTFVNDYYPETRGICAFTAEHNGWASTLCNGYGDSHEWRTSAQDHEFMCAKETNAPPPPPPASIGNGMFKFADIGPEKWLLVRHVPAGNQWHKAQDEMAGTSVYGTKVVEESKYLGAAEWSIRFDNINCPKFLFALGDRSKWLVATKDSVIGGWYANSGRPVEKSSSSSSATNPKWYRRNGSLEDPWVSTTDHHPAIGAGEIVYGENHFGSTHAATTLPGHQGANVFCLVD